MLSRRRFVSSVKVCESVRGRQVRELFTLVTDGANHQEVTDEAREIAASEHPSVKRISISSRPLPDNDIAHLAARVNAADADRLDRIQAERCSPE